MIVVVPTSGFSDKNYKWAVEISEKEAAAIMAGETAEVIEFGKEAGAIKDGWILLQNRLGHQVGYRIDNLSASFANHPLYES